MIDEFLILFVVGAIVIFSLLRGLSRTGRIKKKFKCIEKTDISDCREGETIKIIGELN